MSFKLRCEDVPGMPKPVPRWEIFVYSTEMEGVHLRGGFIARGGIRWSDRLEDYRTEILGLMKAQMVKNSVIVPTGAKGGFVLKQPPADRAELLEEERRQYIVLMRGMLDLTDNIVGGEMRRPEGVWVLDRDPDAYLVVAADKGTAHLSDTANEVSAEYGHWLGDAYASGGSAGYDHKALGITAKGAWESAKRHFAELGQDVMTEPFTVVGIGDMSGDVFGNGMLLSPAIRLVAAFDHRHVFIDPDPPPRALAERQRLFDLPASSWDDYDTTLISEGGGVWPRSAKAVPLSPQARAALGIEADSLPPTELCQAILRAPVDMFWNGGIGTFVKASDESHAEVGDRANDALRINGVDLRCRVVVEGGNLGFTQRGRIEFAAAGGRINNDAIDNSAGVDCSDHEVNLKVLLAQAIEAGELTMEGRNELLESVADDVTTPRPLRQLPAGADPVAGVGGVAPADGGLRGADGGAGAGRPARPGARVPADDGADGRARGRGGRHGPSRAVRAAGLREAAGARPAAALLAAGRPVSGRATSRCTSPALSWSGSARTWSRTRCAARSSPRSSSTT